MTTAAAGYGATLTSSSVTVTQMTRVAFSGLAVTDVEVSNMSSTGAAKEFVPGMIDYGTIEADLMFEGAMSAAVGTQIAARDATETWTLTVPDGTATTTFACAGYINSFNMDAPQDDAVTGTISIKCTGVGTFTA